MGSRIQRAADAEARRERMVDVSMRHFAEHGFRGTRVEDIATEVGVAKGTVFLDFTNREGLFLAAYQRAVSSLPAWLDAPEDVVESGFWATLGWGVGRAAGGGTAARAASGPRSTGGWSGPRSSAGRTGCPTGSP